MKKKKTKKLKELFFKMYGRYPKKAKFDDNGKLIQKDEFREFKKNNSKLV